MQSLGTPRGKRRETKRGASKVARVIEASSGGVQPSSRLARTSQPKHAVSRRQSRTARSLWPRAVLLPRATVRSQQAQAS